MIGRIRRRVLRWGTSDRAPVSLRRRLRKLQVDHVRSTLSPAQVERGDTVIRWRDTARIASPLPGGDVDRACEANHSLVVDGLDDAGVEHFDIPLKGGWTRRIGVLADRRDDVTRRLVGSAPEGAYVRAYIGRRCVVPTRLLSTVDQADLDGVDRVEVWRFYVVPESGLRLGERYCCEVEFWDVDDDQMVASLRNRVGGPLPLALSTQLVPHHATGALTLAPMARPFFDDVTFPVDVVYTWVDGSDPEWAARKATALDGGVHHPESDHESRFRDRDELRYSLRSIHRYLPWVRHVYLVTDRQRPTWLAADSDWITVVDHTEILEAAALPTFNSHAIETALHRVPGLSEHFLYFNDDVFIGRPLRPETFFASNGASRMFLSRSLIPSGPATYDDPPQLAARRHTQRVLASLVGREANQLFKHTPHAFRRSVLEELHAAVGAELQATAANRVRDRDDVVLVWLYHYYAYFTGRAIPSEISYDYFDTKRVGDRRKMRDLLTRRTLDTFCLNDVVGVSTTEDIDRGEFVAQFLARLLPEPSPVERPTADRPPTA